MTFVNKPAAYYFCPDHGEYLGMDSGTNFVCPSTATEFQAGDQNVRDSYFMMISIKNSLTLLLNVYGSKLVTFDAKDP